MVLIRYAGFLMIHESLKDRRVAGHAAIRFRINQVLIIMAGFLAGGPSALAQGTVIFNNYDLAKNIYAPIYDLAIGEMKLEGTAYFAQLFGGPEGTPPGQLQPIGSPVNFRTGAAAGFVDVGTGSVVAIPDVPFGSKAFVQVRAWSANGGATWKAAIESAFNNYTVHTGESILLSVQTASSPEDPNIPGLLFLQPFAIGNACGDCDPGHLVISWSNGLPRLSINGIPGIGYALEYASAIPAGNRWQRVMGQTNLTLTNDTQFFLDSSATGATQRFYRARRF
jgi:hypothetical protein